MLYWKAIALGFAVTAQVVSVAAMDVVDLTAANVDQVIDGSTNVLVYFYLNVCANCRAMAPEIEAAADVLVPSDQLRIARLNGDDEPGVAERFGVSGAPVFKWFAKGQTSRATPTPFYVVHFSGRLSNTILAKAAALLPALQGIEVVADKKHVATLKGAAAFDAAVAGPAGSWVLVVFFTPWAESDGAKRGLQAVGHAFDAYPGRLRIAKVEVETKVERELAYAHGITEFPGVLLFQAGPGAKAAVVPHAPEEPAALVAAVAAATGLSPALGRKRAEAMRPRPASAALDALAPLLAQWASVTHAARASGGDGGQGAALATVADAKVAILHAQDAAGGQAPAAGSGSTGPTVAEVAAFYVKTLAKVGEKGTVYLAEERARVDSLLSRGVAETKRPLFYARRDVLDAFLAALAAAAGHAAAHAEL